MAQIYGGQPAQQRLSLDTNVLMDMAALSSHLRQGSEMPAKQWDTRCAQCLRFWRSWVIWRAMEQRSNRRARTKRSSSSRLEDSPSRVVRPRKTWKKKFHCYSEQRNLMLPAKEGTMSPLWRNWNCARPHPRNVRFDHSFGGPRGAATYYADAGLSQVSIASVKGMWTALKTPPVVTSVSMGR